jgi:hypothetical protein
MVDISIVDRIVLVFVVKEIDHVDEHYYFDRAWFLINWLSNKIFNAIEEEEKENQGLHEIVLGVTKERERDTSIYVSDKRILSTYAR